MWEKISKDRYKQELEKVKFQTFFHQVRWHNFLEEEFSWIKMEYFLAPDVALLPAARIGKNLICLPFCEYAGALPLQENVDWKQVCKKLPPNTKINFHPQIWESEAESGLETWIVDLDKSEEELQMGLRQTLRHVLRKAQGQHFEIEKVSQEADLQDFYELYARKMKERGAPCFPLSFFLFWLGEPAAEIWVAKKEGRVEAGSVFLRGEKWLHYFINASSRAGSQMGANALLLWEFIRENRGGKRILDLGAVRPNTPAATFKKGWGATSLAIQSVPKANNDAPSGVLRKIWQKLPVACAKRMSGWAFRIFYGK